MEVCFCARLLALRNAFVCAFACVADAFVPLCHTPVSRTRVAGAAAGQVVLAPRCHAAVGRRPVAHRSAQRVSAARTLARAHRRIGALAHARRAALVQSELLGALAQDFERPVWPRADQVERQRLCAQRPGAPAQPFLCLKTKKRRKKKKKRFQREKKKEEKKKPERMAARISAGGSRARARRARPSTRPSNR